MDTKSNYINRMHNFGRFCCVASILIMLSLPLIMGIYYHVFPDFPVIIGTTAALWGTFIPITIGEIISFSPVLGSSTYLAFITGNVTNCKIPAAVAAQQLVDAPSGSENADAIGGIAVAVSTFTAISILTVGVILMVPLQPVLNLPSVRTATGYILPAIYGYLAFAQLDPRLGGGLSSPNRLKGAVPAVVLIAIACLLDKFVFHTGYLNSYTGVVIIVLLPILYFSTSWMYQRGMIQVDGPPQ